jgi:hypothetical protein
MKINNVTNQQNFQGFRVNLAKSGITLNELETRMGRDMDMVKILTHQQNIKVLGSNKGSFLDFAIKPLKNLSACLRADALNSHGLAASAVESNPSFKVTTAADIVAELKKNAEEAFKTFFEKNKIIFEEIEDKTLFPKEF